MHSIIDELTQVNDDNIDSINEKLYNFIVKNESRLNPLLLDEYEDVIIINNRRFETPTYKQSYDYIIKHGG